MHPPVRRALPEVAILAEAGHAVNVFPSDPKNSIEAAYALTLDIFAVDPHQQVSRHSPHGEPVVESGT